MITRTKVQAVAAAFLWVLLALASSGISAQVVREDAALVDAPDGKAVVLNMKAGTVVRVLKRQGFWVQVDVGGKPGWIKASALNFSSGSGGPTAIDTGRLGQSNIVATSTARGMSAKDLVNGKPNLEEVAWLEARPMPTEALQAFLTNGSVVAAAGRIQLSAPRPSVAPAAGQGSTGEAKNAPKKKGDDDW